MTDLPPTATITSQLNHRSIRRYTDERLTPSMITTLLDVARHAPTSSFLQQYTVIRVTDPDVREGLHQSSGQPYVGGSAGELFVFVADVHRNVRIREQAGLGIDVLESASVFIQALQDAMLAAQNMVVAAESMGLGTVYLGSINNHPRRTIDVLRLPKHTYPAVGLLVGHPAQQPQLKPRLPREVTCVENTYPQDDDLLAALRDYDAEVTGYYDLRDANRRLDSFTKQIRDKLNMHSAERDQILSVLHEQGLALH